MPPFRKAIARHVRAPLAQISSPAEVSVASLVRARRALREVVDRVPLLMLLSPTVERELGAKKFTALCNIAQTKCDAAQLETAGAAEDRWSGRHGEL